MGRIICRRDPSHLGGNTTIATTSPRRGPIQESSSPLQRLPTGSGSQILSEGSEHETSEGSDYEASEGSDYEMSEGSDYETSEPESLPGTSADAGRALAQELDVSRQDALLSLGP